MLAEVKKCADSNDIKGLHYIFVDCLDVDPTFERYATDYEYCKSIVGFLEPYTNITPIRSKDGWNKQYWEQLKLDLMKNFSDVRFNHMRDVARVIYAEKIERLKQERGKADVDSFTVSKDTKNIDTIQKHVVEIQPIQETTKSVIHETVNQGDIPVISAAEKQQRELLEKRRALELHNQQIEKKQQADRARIEAAIQTSNENNQASKKSQGVVVAAVAVIAIIVVVVLIMGL